jgi:hypothetical protein
LARVRSATTCLSRRFSSSSCRTRRSSATPSTTVLKKLGKSWGTLPVWTYAYLRDGTCPPFRCLCGPSGCGARPSGSP